MVSEISHQTYSTASAEAEAARAVPAELPEYRHGDEVDKIAAAIRGRLNGIRKDMVAIGRDLLRAKALLRHGQWMPWLSAEFGMTSRTAENYMNVAKRFGDKFESLSNLRLETAYKLAARSTSDAVVDAVLARASREIGLSDAEAAAMLPKADRPRSSRVVQEPVAVAPESPPRSKNLVDPLNDWTTQAFELLKSQIKDKARLKTLAYLLPRADIDGLVDKIDSYVSPPT